MCQQAKLLSVEDGGAIASVSAAFDGEDDVNFGEGVDDTYGDGQGGSCVDIEPVVEVTDDSSVRTSIRNCSLAPVGGGLAGSIVKMLTLQSGVSRRATTKDSVRIVRGGGRCGRIFPR